MAILDLTLSLLIFIIGIGILVLAILSYKRLNIMSEYTGIGYIHLRYFRTRDDFNKIGIEIVNGGIPGDTIYAVLRTGTFSNEFATVLSKFHSLSNTRIIIITPDSEVFLSNCREDLHSWISALYENPYCIGTRSLLLEPMLTQKEERMRGYLLISDGHVHDNDEGFYTNTPYSANFLLGYFNCLIRAGTAISLVEHRPNDLAKPIADIISQE